MKSSEPAGVDRAKAALRRQFGGRADANGYVDRPEDNLISGVRLEQFESDLRRGDGNELQAKFRALHSSAALAVNSFAPFKDRPGDLTILGHRGVAKVEFERRLKIFPTRLPANLDIWIEVDDGAVGVESKFLEYFAAKKATFAPAYDRLAPPESEPSWWRAYQAAKDGEPQHLDRAQLIKHYFGLQRALRGASAPRQLTLLYLFWEPTNWAEVAECREHRQQVEAFAAQVAGSSIQFRWMTYPDLWTEWGKLPVLEQHAGRLLARYELRL